MKSIIGKRILYDWTKLLDLQPKELKTPLNKEDLKTSLKKNNFVIPFYGYKDEEGIWIIDGHLRKQVLYELIHEGEPVPELLEVQLINCENKDKALEILLDVFNQKQNPMNEEVVIELIEVHNLEVNVESLNMNVSETEDYLTPIDKIKKENLKPFRRTHILLSFDPQKLLLIQDKLNEILLTDGIEYEQYEQDKRYKI